MSELNRREFLSQNLEAKLQEGISLMKKVSHTINLMFRAAIFKLINISNY